MSKLLTPKELEKQQTEEQFVPTVREMRKNQKEYFKTHMKRFLFTSKELEKKVDVMLEILGE